MFMDTRNIIIIITEIMIELRIIIEIIKSNFNVIIMSTVLIRFILRPLM